ncbi:conserved hypothetical protein [Trichinella spiralis]|uniref:hypothetical protein n=1 Tax=Trichinella spiralis TaxID=6334 RepID=UPI0001EFE02F|nr:conserved hypothetical protein [Trichinella spiralis]
MVWVQLPDCMLHFKIPLGTRVKCVHFLSITGYCGTKYGKMIALAVGGSLIIFLMALQRKGGVLDFDALDEKAKEALDMMEERLRQNNANLSKWAAFALACCWDLAVLDVNLKMFLFVYEHSFCFQGCDGAFLSSTAKLCYQSQHSYLLVR